MAVKPQQLDQMSFSVGDSLPPISGKNGQSFDPDSVSAEGAPPAKDEPAEEVDTQAEEQESADSDIGFFGEDGKGKGQDSDDPDEQGGQESFRFKDDGVEYELNPVKDRDEIQKRLSMFNAGKRAFKESARLRGEMKSLKEELKELPRLKERDALFSRLEEAEGDFYEMYAIITGGKDAREVVKAEAEWQRQYADASEEKREAMDARREAEEAKRKADRVTKQQTKAQERSAQQSEAARERELQTMALPYWKQIKSQLAIKDTVLRDETAAAIWERMWSKISDRVKDPSEVTQKMIKEEAVAAAKLFSASVTKQTEEKVRTTVQEIKKDAKQKAGVVATRNYQKDDMSKYSGKDPLEVFNTMFRGRRK